MTTTVPRLKEIFAEMHDAIERENYERIPELQVESNRLLEHLENEMSSQGQDTDAVRVMREWAEGILQYVPKKYMNGSVDHAQLHQVEQEEDLLAHDDQPQTETEPVAVAAMVDPAREKELQESIQAEKEIALSQVQDAARAALIGLEGAIETAHALQDDLTHGVQQRLDVLQQEIAQTLRDQTQTEARAERERLAELLVTVENTIRSLKHASDSALTEGSKLVDGHMSDLKDGAELLREQTHTQIKQELETLASGLKTQLVQEQNIVQNAQVNLEMMQDKLTDHGKALHDQLAASAKAAQEGVATSEDSAKNSIKIELEGVQTQLSSEREHIANLSRQLQEDAAQDIARFREVSVGVGELLTEMEGAHRHIEQAHEDFKTQLRADAQLLVDELMATSEKSTRARIGQIQEEGATFTQTLDEFGKDLARLQDKGELMLADLDGELDSMRQNQLGVFDEQLVQMQTQAQAVANEQSTQTLQVLQSDVATLKAKTQEAMQQMHSQMQTTMTNVVEKAEFASIQLDAKKDQGADHLQQLTAAAQARLTELVGQANQREVEYQSLSEAAAASMSEAGKTIDEASQINTASQDIHTQVVSQRTELEKVYEQLQHARQELVNMEEFLNGWAPALQALPQEATTVRALLESKMEDWQQKLVAETESFVEVTHHVESMLQETVSLHRQTQDSNADAQADMEQRHGDLQDLTHAAQADLQALSAKSAGELVALNDKAASCFEQKQAEWKQTTGDDTAAWEQAAGDDIAAWKRAVEQDTVARNKAVDDDANIWKQSVKEDTSIWKQAAEESTALWTAKTQQDAQAWQENVAQNAEELQNQADGFKSEAFAAHAEASSSLQEVAGQSQAAMRAAQTELAQASENMQQAQTGMQGLSDSLEEKWQSKDISLTEIQEKAARSMQRAATKTNKVFEETLQGLQTEHGKVHELLEAARVDLWESGAVAQQTQEIAQQVAATWGQIQASENTVKAAAEATAGSLNKVDELAGQMLSLSESTHAQHEKIAEQAQSSHTQMDEWQENLRASEERMHIADTVIQGAAKRVKDHAELVESQYESAHSAQQKAEDAALRVEIVSESIGEHLIRARDEHAQAYTAADECAVHLQRMQALLATEVDNHPVLKEVHTALAQAQKGHMRRVVMVAIMSALLGAAISSGLVWYLLG